MRSTQSAAVRPDRSILFITQTVFHPRCYAGDSARLAEIIRFFRESGWRVLVSHQHDPDQDFADYDAMAQHCDVLEVVYPDDDDIRRRATGDMDAWCSPRLIDSSVLMARRHRVAAAMAQFVFSSACLAALTTDQSVLRILDADNVFTDRAEKFRAQGIPYSWFSTDENQERSGLQRADVILAVQNHEACRFAKLAPGRPILMLPYSTAIRRTERSAGQRILFVGAANHENLQGLLRFIAEALPAIRRQQPHAVLDVVGAVGNLLPEGLDAVHVHGVVQELDSYYARAALVVNTTDVGTGMKTKTVEALCHGRCLVSTSAGIQGLEDQQGAYVLANSPRQFAEAVILHLRDQASRHRVEAAGQALAIRCFAPHASISPVEQFVHRWHLEGGSRARSCGSRS